MAHFQSSVSRPARTAVIAFVLVLCAIATPASAQAGRNLSKREVKALAGAPGGHQRLAAYYRDRARQLREKAQKFSDQADYLATQPALMESKQGISCNCTGHYRYFAKVYAQEADKAESMAAQQDRLSTPADH